MAKRFVDLRTAIEMYLMTDTKLKVKFSETEWALLKDLVALFKPLYTATVGLSQSKYTSLRLTLPIYMGLIEV